MSIKRFFNQDIIVRRLTTVSGDKRRMAAVATVAGHIQAVDRLADESLGPVNKKFWKAWFDVDEDIQEQDKIVDSASVEYVVVEVVKVDFGINQHLEVILEEFAA